MFRHVYLFPHAHAIRQGARGQVAAYRPKAGSGQVPAKVDLRIRCRGPCAMGAMGRLSVKWSGVHHPVLGMGITRICHKYIYICLYSQSIFIGFQIYVHHPK